MAFQQTLMMVGMTGLLGACAMQQPAKVVNGYGQPQMPSVYGPVAAKSPQLQVKAEVATPPVLLDPPGVTRQAIREEPLATIAPAAGPIITMVPKPIAAVAEPQPLMVEHTVLRSDTAYKLARKYNTTVERILKDNNLASMADVKEGRTLQISQGSKPQYSAWDDMKKMLNEAATPEPIRTAQNVEPEQQIVNVELPKAIVEIEPAAGESTQLNRKVMPEAVAPVKVEPVQDYAQHTVQPKETIFRISQQYHVSVLDIMAANDFSEPQDLKANAVIKVPVKVSQVALKKEADVAPAAGEPVQVAMLTKTETRTDAEPVAEVKAVQEPVVSSIKEDKLDAKLAEQKRGQIDPVAARAKGLVWPVKGEVVKTFGDDGHGVARTGINIAVPQGTPVLASDGGTVLYADDGLKIYGKLVLIRHDSGMVSAYAHNGYLLVKKNEKVKKGQIVALSGATGNVESPQVHFELRQHASAIDPIAMLPRR